MLKYFTLRNKIDYSLTSFYNYMTTNFWAFTSWVCSTYLLPIKTVMGIMLVMVVFDFITGIWKSKKVLNEPFNSKKIAISIEKISLYFIGALSSLALQNHIGIDIIKPLWLFSTLVITREYVSVIENIEAITGTKLVEVIKEQIAKLFFGNRSIDSK